MSDPLTPKDGEEVRHVDGARVWRGHDGVLRHVVETPNLQIRQMWAAFRALRELADHRRLPVLVDLRAVRVIKRATREIAMGPEMTSDPAAIAIIVGNPVTRVIGTFAYRVHRPNCPVRLFTDPEAALQWALEQRLVESDIQTGC